MFGPLSQGFFFFPTIVLLFMNVSSILSGCCCLKMESRERMLIVAWWKLVRSVNKEQQIILACHHLCNSTAAYLNFICGLCKNMCLDVCLKKVFLSALSHPCQSFERDACLLSVQRGSVHPVGHDLWNPSQLDSGHYEECATHHCP